jgi:hypothetical protein
VAEPAPTDQPAGLERPVDLGPLANLEHGPDCCTGCRALLEDAHTGIRQAARIIEETVAGFEASGMGAMIGKLAGQRKE